MRSSLQCMIRQVYNPIVNNSRYIANVKHGCYLRKSRYFSSNAFTDSDDVKRLQLLLKQLDNNHPQSNSINQTTVDDTNSDNNSTNLNTESINNVRQLVKSINSSNNYETPNNNNASSISRDTNPVINKLLSIQGIVRTSSIRIKQSRLTEFLDYYRNNIKPNTYKDAGFIQAHLLINNNINKDNDNEEILTIENITLWHDESSIKRNNQREEYQKSMQGLSEFIIQPPVITQYKLAETIANDIPANTFKIEDKPEQIIEQNTIAQCFSLASNYMQDNQPKLALDYFNQVINIANKTNQLTPEDRSTLLLSHIHIAKILNNKVVKHLDETTKLIPTVAQNINTFNLDDVEEALSFRGTSKFNRSNANIKNRSKQYQQFPPLNTGVSYS